MTAIDHHNKDTVLTALTRTHRAGCPSICRCVFFRFLFFSGFSQRTHGRNRWRPASLLNEGKTTKRERQASLQTCGRSISYRTLRVGWILRCLGRSVLVKYNIGVRRSCPTPLSSPKISQHSSPHHQRSRPSSHLTHTCTTACAINSQPLRRRSSARSVLSSSEVARHSTFHHAWRRRACSEYKFSGTAVGANASANFPANYCVAPLNTKNAIQALFHRLPNTSSVIRHTPSAHASHQLR